MGLMGAVAETVAAGLGEESVIGVIPGALAPREVGEAQPYVMPVPRRLSAFLYSEPEHLA